MVQDRTEIGNRSAIGEADELAIEIKMPGDHLDLLSLDRALLRRLARQIQRREDPMDELRFNVGEKTDDPDVRARQRMLLGWLLDALPEQREELMEVGEIQEARTALRDVLAARRISLSADDEAQVDACADHDTLRRWRKQAVVAASAAEALR